MKTLNLVRVSTTQIFQILVLLSLLLASPTYAMSDREFGSRFGLTPQQTREIFAKVDSNNALISSLTSKIGVKKQVIRAIAFELNVRNPGISDDKFYDLVQAKVKDAAKAQKSLLNLKETISALDPSGDRTKALDLFKKAQIAFHKGLLKDAEELFEKLSFLRLNELSSAHSAWLQAADLQALSASLRGDVETADQILSSKSTELKRESDNAERERWRTEMTRAFYWTDSGKQLNLASNLQRAVKIYRNDALPLVSREHSFESWSETQQLLGDTLVRIFKVQGGKKHIDDAIQCYNEVLNVLDGDHHQKIRSRIRVQLASALALLGYADETRAGQDLIKKALDIVRVEINSVDSKNDNLELAQIHVNMGLSLFMLGVRKDIGIEDRKFYISDSIKAYEAAKSHLDPEENPELIADVVSKVSNASAIYSDLFNDFGILNFAIESQGEMLKKLDKNLYPVLWLRASVDHGNSLLVFGAKTSNKKQLLDTINYFKKLLSSDEITRFPTSHAMAQLGLCATFRFLIELDQNRSLLEFEKGCESCINASMNFRAQENSNGEEKAKINLSEIQKKLRTQFGQNTPGSDVNSHCRLEQ